MSGITCLACNVSFEDVEIGRIHYKTEWHRYNLKRKVAGLGPITLEKFEERQKAQEQSETATVHESCVCKPCNKSFSTANAYDNHLQSKKHKEVTSGTAKSKKGKKKKKTVVRNSSKSTSASGSTTADKKDGEDQLMSDEEGDDDGSEAGSWDSYDEQILGLEECLFCSQISSSMEDSIAHMTGAHGFFLPDAEYICDLEGLISYLGEKVGAGHYCVWCNEKGKRFHNAKDVQRHMVDKGHCKLLHTSETIYEFADFYDYSKSYPTEEGALVPHSDPSDPVDIMELDGDGYSITLPSGAVIGHRSLMIYYRQNLVPQLRERTRAVLPKMLAQYKALGWTGATGTVVAQRAKDLQYMQRVRNRHFMRVGCKGNALRLRLRQQNPI